MTERVCLNCSTPLTGAYCARCGQKDVDTDPTLRSFLHELLHELAHWEGKIPSTLKALFFQPGVLTRDFLGGRRARWLPPLRLYLICSVAFFLSGPLMALVTGKPQKQMAQFSVRDRNEVGPLTPEQRAEIREGRPARIFGADRIERAAVDGPRLNRAINSAFPKAMFVLLPFFALLTRFAWRRTLPRYPAHLYLALHLHAAWFGIFAVMTIVAAPLPRSAAAALGAIGLSYVVIYGLLSARVMFSDSWIKTIAKSAVVSVLYAVGFMPVAILMMAYAIWTM